MYRDDQRLVVYPFSRQPDGDEVIVGRAETGIFVAIPDRAVFLLDVLASGSVIATAVAQYQAEYNETPDIQAFLGAMAHYGLIEDPINFAGEQPAPVPESKGRHYSEIFPERLARLLFSRPALVIYGTIASLSVILMALHPSLIVTDRDLEFPDHRTLTLLLLTIGSYVALALHELGHMAAARSLGLKSRFGFGHRLWILVVETDLTGLWSVPKAKRYVPLLAGIIVDSVIAALLIILLFAASTHFILFLPYIDRVLRGLVFMYFMRIAWQCSFFIRTDLYYVLATFTGCKNLMQDTEVYLRNGLSRVLSRVRHTDQFALPAHEQRAVRYYSYIWIIGRVFSVVLLLTITIPVSIYYVRSVGATLAGGFAAAPASYIDSILLSLYILLPIAIGMAMWLNSVFNRLRGSLR